MPTALITPEALLGKEGRHTEILRDAGFEIVFPRDPHFARGHVDDAGTVSEVREADALIAGGEYVRAAAFRALPRLRVIARTGVGYDRIDIDAATKHAIPVTITPTANHAAVAEHALSLLFAISKRVVEHDRRTRAGEWPRALIEPIRSKTLGILGLGRIGRSMALRSRALGMSVIAHDPFADAHFATQNDIRLMDFDELVRQCDVLTVHCPSTDSTRGILNADVFSKMKPTAILINTARGPIVNETDLVLALRNQEIMGAGLDVLAQEPPAPDNPLFELDNVVITPHTAGLDRLAHRDMAIEAAECVVQLYRGEWPDAAVVNPQIKPGWKW